MKPNVPQEWFETTYRNIGDFLGGGTPSTKEPDFWNGNIDWTTSRRINDSIYISNGEKKITKSGINHSSTNLVPRGNLLIATRVGVGKVAINTVDMAISQDLTGLIVNKEKYSLELIAYQTRSCRIQEAFRRQKRGATIKGISREDLKDFILYIPLLAEQQKIAAVLLKIHKAIEVQESIIEAAQELKKSTMEHVFTYGLRGEKTKETEIGRIPESWEIKKFGEFATLHRGYDLPIQDRKKGKVPIVGSNGICGYHNQSRIKGPGVVTGRSGSIGISYYVNDDYWPLNTGLYVENFHNNDPLYSHYFFQFFNFKKYSSGVSVPTLNRNLVHAAFIAAPLIKEQNDIASVFKTIDDKIEVHSTKKSALQDIFKTMLNKLMTGQIRVKDLDIDTSCVLEMKNRG